jgi:lipid II:glycine glycyltransferase (peptidoglycan interpeptide bridge formation enzyme)
LTEATPTAELRDEPTPDWDALAVDRPGGHVLQSAAWAEHRRASGWRPRFAVAGEHRVLALVRPWPLLGGGSAYIPRGPAPVTTGSDLGAALWAVTRALAREGVDVVAADAEVRAEDEAWQRWLRRAGFHRIEEIQPSRHRLSLPLVGDEDATLAAVAKSTRKRIRRAERDGIAVVRHDVAAVGEPGDGFAAPAEPTEAALDRFYDLLLETGERRDFHFGPRSEFMTWWRRAHAAGHLIYLEARDAGPTGDPLAGLVLYRHGGRHSTVHSGDHAAARSTHPGALHLLRWRAIQLAIRDGCSEMDLSGVDVPGARRPPVEGEPMHGLLQHKLSFGAQWLELSGAHERVVRPRRYRAGRVVSGVFRRLPGPLRR